LPTLSLPPVVVGFHNLEGGGVISLPEIREALVHLHRA